MDQLLAWFETYDADRDRVRAFWDGAGRYIISVYSTQHNYRQVFDGDVIVREAPRHLRAQADLPGLNMPSLYADWGTVSTAKYWGGTVRFDSTGMNIFVDPMAQTVDEALEMEPLPVDDPSMDAHFGIRLFREVSEALQTDALWLRTPDMQGTLNTAGLIVNQEELMVAMYTDGDKVHALLDKVCDFLIRYARYLRQETDDRVCGNIWPYTFFPAEIGVALTEDLMPLMSADMYKEFGIPYLRKIQDAMGGLHIHCCGDWGRHAENLKESGLDIKAVEFHYPATKIEELACLADETVFVPYIILDRQDEFRSVTEYYRHLMEETDPSYRFWFACADDSPDVLAFAREYGDTG
jgi:hypothetical protein